MSSQEESCGLTCSASDLNNQPYWAKDPSLWDLTDFDIEYVKSHPSASKVVAHEALAVGIMRMRKRHKKDPFICSRLKVLRKSLKKSESDLANKYFWERARKNICVGAVEQQAALLEENVWISKYLVASIKQRTKKLTVIERETQCSDDSHYKKEEMLVRDTKGPTADAITSCQESEIEDHKSETS
ncbi:hypothetical protein BJV82DRAFT_617096 [Fennellomyces sp. T-0311]|nr:hypothetical protein BJV82DRAFT_617096 [Fennellomyces sp. T-0311]